MSSTPTNIANLKGKELFAALSSNQPISCRKRKTSRETKPKIVDNLAPATAQHWDWKDTTLVLFNTSIECACGKCYEYPSTNLFLRRESPDGTVHYTQLEANVEDPESRFKDLECLIETRRESRKACQFCFDLAHVIDRARAPKKPATPAVSLATPPPTPAGPDPLDFPETFPEDLDDPSLDSAFLNLD